MSATFENLRVLQAAEEVADAVWNQIGAWSEFARDTVGKQLARAVDSIGANIAESFGRFSFGEKLQFLYYARGSLFESKYWLNRSKSRKLMPEADCQNYIVRLTDLARQLNTFAKALKSVRADEQKHPRSLRESAPEYFVADGEDSRADLFSEDELTWLNY